MEELLAPFFVYCLVVLGLMGVATLGAHDPHERIRVALGEMARTPIAHAKEGEAVKIVGTVAARPTTLAAPLTARLCFYYCIVIEERQGRRWSTLLREERGVDFLLQDDSGVALVRPPDQPQKMGALLTALRFDEGRRLSLWQRDEGLEQLLAARGLSSSGLIWRSFRAVETVIVAGQRLAVAGRGRWEADPDGDGASYREAARRLTLQVSDMPLFISDDSSVFGPR